MEARSGVTIAHGEGIPHLGYERGKGLLNLQPVEQDTYLPDLHPLQYTKCLDPFSTGAATSDLLVFIRIWPGCLVGSICVRGGGGLGSV